MAWKFPRKCSRSFHDDFWFNDRLNLGYKNQKFKTGEQKSARKNHTPKQTTSNVELPLGDPPLWHHTLASLQQLCEPKKHPLELYTLCARRKKVRYYISIELNWYLIFICIFYHIMMLIQCCAVIHLFNATTTALSQSSWNFCLRFLNGFFTNFASLQSLFFFGPVREPSHSLLSTLSRCDRQLGMSLDFLFPLSIQQEGKDVKRKRKRYTNTVNSNKIETLWIVYPATKVFALLPPFDLLTWRPLNSYSQRHFACFTTS